MSLAPNSAMLVVVSAPSGAGKTTLCQAMLSRRPELARVVTCTTRPPRAGEAQDVDYHFLDSKDFQTRLQAGEFLEHALVHGNHYGTLKSEVRSHLESGRSVLLNIDVQGAAAVRACGRVDPDLRHALVTVFLMPPSLVELENRLRKRAQDPEPVIARRLQAAREEVARWREFDYIIVSDTPEEDLRRFSAILEVESLRPERVRVPDI